MDTNYKHAFARVYYVLKDYTDEDHSLTRKEIQRKIKKIYDTDISEKTISRYIDCLIDMGFDIKNPSGRNFGYRFIDKEFDLYELKMIIDALQAAQFIPEEDTQRIINKICKLTSKENAKELQRQVYLAGTKKTTNKDIFYSADAVRRAITNNKCISFQYLQWNNDKQMELKHNGDYYDVSPFFIVWNKDKYYLVGWDNKCGYIKHFRIDKMKSVEEAENERTAMDEYEKINPAEYVRHKFNMFSGKDHRVRFICSKEFVDIALDTFGHESILLKKDDGTYEITAVVTVSDQFFGWLTGELEGISIAGPKCVEDEFRNFIKRIARNVILGDDFKSAKIPYLTPVLS